MVLVIAFQQAQDLSLCAPRLTLEVGEEVRIGDVWFVGWIVEIVVENRLEFVDKLPLSAHQFGQSANVVGYVESVVPRRSLMEARCVGEVGTILGVEGREEGSVAIDGAQDTCCRVVVVLVAEASLAEDLCVLLVSEVCGQKREGIVGNIIFQCVRYRVVSRVVLGEHTERDVAFADVGIDVASHFVLCSWERCTLAESLIRLVDVEVAESLQPGIRDDRDGGVALHGPGLASEQFPARHPSPFVIHGDH